MSTPLKVLCYVVAGAVGVYILLNVLAFAFAATVLL